MAIVEAVRPAAEESAGNPRPLLKLRSKLFENVVTDLDGGERWRDRYETPS